MTAPGELSIAEIRNYMLEKNGKVTNHTLVKQFKRFLTNPETINEARKKFKAYVNILATVKLENGHKYLILREKYVNECPSEEVVQRALAAATASGSVPNSPAADNSAISEISLVSPRLPPPYKPPPEVEDAAASSEADERSHSSAICVCPALGEPKPNNSTVVEAVQLRNEEKKILVEPIIQAELVKTLQSTERSNSIDEQSNKENIPRFSFSSGNSGTSVDSSSGENAGKSTNSDAENAENPISVKEATQKFNRMASKEDIISPPAKKKPEKQLVEEKNEPEVTLSHPKAKEWIVIMSRANYQELAKLAKDYPELVKLQDPATGYTALHWAAKHGNEDVVKLIAGTYKADVNARTNGGYTPLHLAMQFGRVNIFELLCNVYKANRDLMDWSGNKPLDYSKQRTSVSASTYSSEYYDLFNKEVDDVFAQELRNYFAGAGSGSSTVGGAISRSKKRSQLRPHADNSVTRTKSMMNTMPSRRRQNKQAVSLSMIIGDQESILPAGTGIRSPPASTSKKSERLQSPESTLVSSTSAEAATTGNEPIARYKDNTSSKSKHGTAPAQRKQSFLRKTLRATVAPKKPNTGDTVTNKTLPE